MDAFLSKTSIQTIEAEKRNVDIAQQLRELTKKSGFREAEGSIEGGTELWEGENNTEKEWRMLPEVHLSF